MVHDQHVYQKWHVFVICFVQSGDSYGFIPSAVWRLTNKFSSSFRCRKLTFTTETFHIFEFLLGVVGRHVGGC